MHTLISPDRCIRETSADAEEGSGSDTDSPAPVANMPPTTSTNTSPPSTSAVTDVTSRGIAIDTDHVGSGTVEFCTPLSPVSRALAERIVILLQATTEAVHK